MNAHAQLSMFEPEGAEAVQLLRRHLAAAKRHAVAGAFFDAMLMPGASRREFAMQQQAEADALVFAILLDLEAEAGL